VRLVPDPRRAGSDRASPVPARAASSSVPAPAVARPNSRTSPPGKEISFERLRAKLLPHSDAHVGIDLFLASVQYHQLERAVRTWGIDSGALAERPPESRMNVPWTPSSL
jgi:hypothetical protein